MCSRKTKIWQFKLHIGTSVRSKHYYVAQPQGHKFRVSVATTAFLRTRLSNAIQTASLHNAERRCALDIPPKLHVHVEERRNQNISERSSTLSLLLRERPAISGNQTGNIAVPGRYLQPPVSTCIPEMTTDGCFNAPGSWQVLGAASREDSDGSCKHCRVFLSSPIIIGSRVGAPATFIWIGQTVLELPQHKMDAAVTIGAQ